jgi:diguanylate cyclase (GGDEF)-like protein/PAS domain S-box-containing protein
LPREVSDGSLFSKLGIALSDLVSRLRDVVLGRLGAGLLSLAAFVLFVVPVGSYYTRDHHGLAPRTQDATRDLRLRLAVSETLLRQALATPDTVASGMDADASPRSWEVAARAALKANALVDAIFIQPDGSGRLQFLKEAEESRKPGGPATRVLPNTSGAAMHSDWMLRVDGPAALAVEEGFVVATQALVQDRPGLGSRPWGRIVARVSTADLVRATGLGELASQGYAFTLDWLPEGRERVSLARSEASLRADPVQFEISVVPGSRLRLVASLPASWNVPPISPEELVLLLCGGGLVAVLTYLLLRRSAEMRELVELRTLQLSLDKEVLRSEIELRTRTESELKESHALLDSIFEHIPNMIVLKRASDLKIVRVNRQGEALLGCSKASLLGKSSRELYRGAQAESDTETDLAAIREGGVVEVPEHRMQVPGEAARWVKMRKIALPDASGTPSYILGIGEDITTRKHLDEALTENLNFVEQLLAAIPSPVFFKDSDLRYIGVNRAFEDLFGTTGEALIGKTVHAIATPELAAAYDKADRDLLASGGRQTYEAKVKCADGSVKDVMFFKAVFSTTESKVGGIVGILLDVTEQKAAQRHVLRLNRTLAVVSETNEAILRTRSSQALIQKTVEALHESGGFPLAWVFAYENRLPAMVVVGEHPKLASRISSVLRGSTRCNWEDGAFGPACCDFFQSLAECDRSLAGDMPTGFDSFGLAHLPLRVSGAIAGGLCIIGTTEDLADVEEQGLLANLAENLSHALDALEQEHARQSAERKLELAAHVFENSVEGVMITDRDNKILMVNRRFSEITGYTADEVAGKTPSILNSGQQDKAFYSNMWRSLMNRGEWHGEIRNRRKDGEVIVEWMNISAVKNEAGEIVNFVAVFSEITVHKTIKKRMQFLAHYDALTSLPNRILFSDRFEQSIIAARRNKRCTALMLIDLDRFDQINKSVGHAAGDTLLQEVAGRLLGSVDPGHCVARLGGDEFAIVLADIGGPDDAAVAASRIQQELGRTLYVADTPHYVSASIGIAVYPRDGEDAETLTRSADAAMYLAAESGGNTFRFPQISEKLSEKIKLRERLHRAIERDELKVYFQPLVSSESGRIVGAEALLRWFRPEAGYVSPEFFVPMLEEAGLAVRVGDWVMRTALQHNIAWRKEFDSELFVAVNYCAAQTADEKVVEKLDALMKELTFDARYLNLEISEATLMRDAPAGLTLLHRLNDLGISLSMDNFGTGYSSLSYLNRFPIDALKIDRSFIQDTPNDAEALAITRTIIAMAHALDLKVVAAGVESANQVNFLRRARCDVLQGYRFSQGVSAEEFSRLLAEDLKGGRFFSDSEGPERLHLVG